MIAFIFGIIILSKSKKIFREKFKNIDLDKLNYKIILFGFFSQTIMIGAGSIWGYYLWGSFWNWDPIEIWSFLGWLAYALYIHLKIMFNLNKKFFACLAIVNVVFILISFWGVEYFTKTWHIFELF